MDVLCFSTVLLSVFLLGPAGADQSAIILTKQTDFLMGGPTVPTTPGTYLSVSSVTLPASTSPVAEDTPSPPSAPQENVVTTSPTSTFSVKGASPFTESSLVPQLRQSSSSPGETNNMTSMSPSSMPLTATSSPLAERHATASQPSAAPPGSAAATAAHPAPSDTSPRRPPHSQMDVPPTQPPDNSLTMVAFGVMSFILILIIVMVILLTVVNLKGRCRTPEDPSQKTHDSMVSESNMTANGEKESITLVSIKTINTETDTDSPQVSSAHSTTLDVDDQEFRQDLLNSKLV